MLSSRALAADRAKPIFSRALAADSSQSKPCRAVATIWVVRSPVMPPKATPIFRAAPLKDKIDILTKRANELSQKQLLKSLNETLKEEPHLLPGVLRYLQGRGINIQAATQLGKKRVRATIEDDNKEGERSVQPQKLRKGEAVVDGDPNNWLAHCYTRLDNTKVTTLEIIVSAVEPIVCSMYALRGLKAAKSSSESYRTMLLEILEYATGFDVSTSLKGDLRHKPALISHLMKLRDARCARGSNLSLPPVWGSSTDGVFLLKETDGDCILAVDKTTKCSHLLSAPVLRAQLGPDISSKDLCIINNFSEVRASIGCNDDTLTTIPIAGLPLKEGVENNANQQ